MKLRDIALAQETNKPQAKEKSAEGREHRGEGHHRHGMGGMRQMRGGCHGEAQQHAGEHKH